MRLPATSPPACHFTAGPVTAQHPDHAVVLQLHLQQQLQQQRGQPQPRVFRGGALLPALAGSPQPQEPPGQTGSPQLAPKSGVKDPPNTHTPSPISSATAGRQASPCFCPSGSANVKLNFPLNDLTGRISLPPGGGQNWNAWKNWVNSDNHCRPLCTLLARNIERLIQNKMRGTSLALRTSAASKKIK